MAVVLFFMLMQINPPFGFVFLLFDQAWNLRHQSLQRLFAG
jgi:hypothetical protein